ncbi:hypothetical protein LCGC14_0223210 [marine sediment metagenome]|uniref:Uncharacterized protein n=1 Tax=marine sediment metagenome TaxID=412755 RepID=A0A0F9XFU8_9ZZZZ|nr:hypothetical protein [bacterium]
MKFDEIGVKMLNLFLDNEDLTSTEIANTIFKPKNRSESLKKNNLIISRLKTWIKNGVIHNGTVEKRVAHYQLNTDIIKIGRLVLIIDDNIKEVLGDYFVIDIEGQERLIAPIFNE